LISCPRVLSLVERVDGFWEDAAAGLYHRERRDAIFSEALFRGYPLAMPTEDTILRLLTDESQFPDNEQTAQSFVIPDEMIDKTGSGDSVHFELRRRRSPFPAV